MTIRQSIHEQAHVCTLKCSSNKQSLYLPYKTHSYKNGKRKKHTLLLFLKQQKKSRRPSTKGAQH